MYLNILKKAKIFSAVSDEKQLLFYRGIRAVYFHDHLSRFLRSNPEAPFPKEVPFHKTNNYFTVGWGSRADMWRKYAKRREAYFERRYEFFDLAPDAFDDEEMKEMSELMERLSYNPLETLELSEETFNVGFKTNQLFSYEALAGKIKSDVKEFIRRSWEEFVGWESSKFVYREGVFAYYLTQMSPLSLSWNQKFYKSLKAFGNRFTWVSLQQAMKDVSSPLYEWNAPKILPIDYAFKNVGWENSNVHTRTGARLRYRETVHYDQYKQWYDGLVSLLRSYTFFDNELLKKAKIQFEKQPDFKSETYLPRSFEEAVCFFSVYGAPSRKSENSVHNWLFIWVLLSGFYIETPKQTIGGFGFELFRRRLYATHAAIDFSIHAQEAMQHEYFRSWDRHRNEWLAMYWFRHSYLLFEHSVRFIYRFTIKLSQYLFYLFMLKINGHKYDFIEWYQEKEFYYYKALDIITDIQLEVTPFFSNNKLSFVWYYCPVWLEAYILTFYVIYSEICIGSRTWIHTYSMMDMDPEDQYESPYFMDELGDQYQQVFGDFLIDYVFYYYEMTLKPFVDFFIFLPFWVLVDFFQRMHLAVQTFWNNTWHALLTKGDSPDGKIRGRWWKIPLILVRWSFYWVIALHLLWFFLFYLNYEVLAFYLQPYSPMILSTVEVQFTYVTLVFLFVIRACGPYSLTLMLKEEWGALDWFGLAYFNLNLMWVAPAKTIPTANFNPVFWESYAIWDDKPQGEFDYEADTHAIMDIVEVPGWREHMHETAYFALDELGSGYNDYPHPDYVDNPPSMRRQLFDEISMKAAVDRVVEGVVENPLGQDFATAYVTNYYQYIDPVNKEWHNPSFDRVEWSPFESRFDANKDVRSIVWNEKYSADEEYVEHTPIYYELKYNPPAHVEVQRPALVKEEYRRRR